MRSVRIVAFVLVGALSFNDSAVGQEPIPGTWSFLSRPHSDLWFHGLALVGFQGFAPMPLYDIDYSGRMEAAKRAAGVYPTPLDTMAARFRAGFERDSTFELLHFVPLYFGLSSLGEMLDAIEDVADGGAPTDFGSNVVSSVLKRRDQRRILQQFTRALREEWDLFFREYRNEREADVRSTISDAQSVWDRRIAPALSSFLAGRDLAGGVVLASDALGAEGRIFGGDPEDSNDNVAAINLPASRDSTAALLLVRELCYPLVSDLVARRGSAAGDRVLAERISSRAAVRCGAILLEENVSEFSDPYRRLFLDAIGEPGSSEQAFQRAFPVDARLIQALRSELALN